MPLYINPFTINEGNYNLRITLTDGNTSKVTEVPLTIVKRKSTEIFAIGFAGACVAFVMASFKKLKKCTIRIGARGDITVALFAALAFGGVVVPVTLLGDFFHVILGPFSGLITGVLNGIVQYLLLMALLIQASRCIIVVFPDALAPVCHTFRACYIGGNPDLLSIYCCFRVCAMGLGIL